jgi:hypothetical protein
MNKALINPFPCISSDYLTYIAENSRKYKRFALIESEKKQ